MPFLQDPPRLTNAYLADPLLRELVARALPGALGEVEPELEHLGELAAGRLFAQQAVERLLEPRIEHWDAWGRRVDHIELTPLWREAATLAARHGLVATAYERRHGPASRVHQLALVHVLEPSLDVYACPLAMTDGAARALLDAGNAALVERALPRLTSREPARMWTSGQWMTERIGGSDVSLTETVARRDGDDWRLFGTKWFSSATTAEMALALARPEGAPAGSRGLALFYLETRNEDGTTNGVLVNRLKDKLGTRKLPTAELTLDGARAVPVAGLSGGVRAIAPMLTVTRTWNAVAAVAGMQRALALARDYARRRAAFGAPLAEKPLHADTLAGLEAEREGAFLLAFRAAALLGASEAGVASDAEQLALRAVTPLAKLTTGKQAVAIASEALECFGGAGYVEDTGLPRLLRDAQVLPIWEGTTNVLALDVLRALAGEGVGEALAAEVNAHLAAARDPALRPAIEAARAALARAEAWLAAAAGPAREAGARRLALTLGRTLELALLAAHAQWCLDHGRGPRALAAARRLARHGIDLVAEEPGAEELELLTGPSADGGAR
ncbi:acyl-CoA dehydrogenase family protein [Anaeromyxobacter terrae]|uniref:acyl-CoA dehydrogenase family protein n=1 Tax=Anaeromyxobacter terrae TaxID=2925406 RepID=UPI001F56D68B|nr:acyl-CoA dehydrogenase family protein [Anaeromyxobacter sp. SG22]